ncbi:MAG: hypothetical protein C0468_04125 [Planctomyces sp.]|nr:hypothetical protein [Planctomyces sp.]
MTEPAPRPSLMQELVAPGARLGLAAALAILVGVAVMLPGLLASVSQTAAEPTATKAPAAMPDAAGRRFDPSLRAAERLLGARSPFYPVRVAPPPPEELTEENYDGPRLIAMINGAAWFEDGSRLEPGEIGLGGLEVVELDAPWGVRVRYRGNVFTLSLFERYNGVLEQPTPRAQASVLQNAPDFRPGASAPPPTPAAAPTPAPPAASAPPSPAGSRSPSRAAAPAERSGATSEPGAQARPRPARTPGRRRAPAGDTPDTAPAPDTPAAGQPA